MSNDGIEISEVVRTQVEMQIIKAFRDTPQYIDELVKACLMKEVTEDGGKPDDWGRRNKNTMPYLTFLARQSIEMLTQKMVKEAINEKEDVIRKQVRTALASDKVTDAFVKNIINATAQDWRVNVEFKTEK